MQSAVQTPATSETNFLYVKNLAPYFHREESQIKFRQVDAGFARHDPQYNKISLTSMRFQPRRSTGTAFANGDFPSL